MKKVTGKTTDSFREKGSKFIGYLFPVETIEAFEKELDGLKSKYPDATHHCYAWRINPPDVREFAQDDGEPGGTAGLPILNQLKSFEAVAAGIVVVRYYGDTKLGKAGLIEAYGRSAELCLQKARMQPIQLIWKIRVTYPYEEQNTLEKLMHRFGLIELEATYLEKVTLLLGCPVTYKEAFVRGLRQLSHRSIEYRLLQEGYV